MNVVSVPGRVRAAAVRVVSRFGLRDRWLLLAVVLGFFAGAQGMGWGRYDCLNLDAMAFQTIFDRSRPPGHPGSFLKPPFYSYICHITARLPAQVISGAIHWKGGPVRDDLYFRIRLVLGRLTNLLMFSSVVVMLFAVTREYFGEIAARASALVLATTAGFVPYQVYLTTDLPVIFLMMASFVCAAAIVRRPTMGLSIAAGLLAGLAAATKYNGLAVAAVLPVAHLLASRGNPILACLRRPAAWACGLAVPAGFVLGNPYAVLDWPKFREDFLYNYVTTPVYGGQTGGTGYAAFLGAFWDIFGVPACLLLIAGLVVGLGRVISGLRRDDAWKLWLLGAVLFGVYMWKIGAFPRMENRFVLPVAPMALLLAAAGFGWLFRSRWLTAPVLAVILGYNLVCVWWVGELFRNDPRMELFPLVREQIQNRPVVEISESIPWIDKVPGAKMKTLRMPIAVERAAAFDKLAAERPDLAAFQERWQRKDGLEWFSPARRAERGTEFVFWSSIDVENIVRPQFDALLAADSGFTILFDRTTPPRPAWVYPRDPEFLANRTVVLKKS